jgi:hypothetical protein
MDQQAGSRDPNADTCAPTEHLRPVPSNGPAAPPQKKGPGPKTPQGKARSSRNAMRFGIYATDPVIPGERREDWQAHRAGIFASATPGTYLETFHAERLAFVSWVLLSRVPKAYQAEFTRANKGQQEFRLPPSNELDKIMKSEGHLTRLVTQHQNWLEVLQAELAPEARVYEVKTITPLNP